MAEGTAQEDAGGRVIAVRGNVVDTAFPEDALPPRQQALRTGQDRGVVLEVKTHLDANRVRTRGASSWIPPPSC